MIAAFPPMKAPEADHAFYLCEHLADYGLDMHVVTTKGSTASTHPRMTVNPIMRDWSWSDLPRLSRFIRDCSPDAILLVYIGWIYNYHSMVTFVPTVSKTLLPHVPFVTLFEDASGAAAALLARAVRKGKVLWADGKNLPNLPSLLVCEVRMRMALWARSMRQRPSLLVWTIRKGMALWSGGKNVDPSYGTLLRDSDRIIAVSELVRARLTERFSSVSSKSVVIPAPPIMRMCPEYDGEGRRLRRQALGVKPDDFLIAYFGYIYPGKGVETLLKAFLTVTARRSNVRLIMVGGNIELRDQRAYMQEIREIPKRMGIDDKVTWTGGYAWDSDEPSGYLRAADLSVLSFDDGVSLHHSSFAAAAAHGLPIITTQGEMLEEPFIHRENVFLCPPRNPAAMAVAIETLMDKPELRQRLRRGALKLAQEWFSWERAVERTIATFRGAAS